MADNEQMDKANCLSLLHIHVCTWDSNSPRSRNGYIFSHSADEATSVARDQTDGEAGDALPLRIGTLCELLVFVKNLELTSSSQLTSKMARLGSK